MHDYLDGLRNASGWSHDIRTHLNILLGAVSVMETGKMSAGQMQEYARIIRSNVLAMLRMVNHMMVEDKACSAETAQMVNAQIDGMLIGVVKAVSPYAMDRQIKLLHDVQSPLFVRCDPEMLERILYNLLSNAIKYTDPGGYVYLSAKKLEAFVRINVADTGRGFTKEQLKLLNEDPQGSLSGRRGLRIVKMLTAAMNGRISCTSQEGIGTTFYLHLSSTNGIGIAVAENKAIALEELSILFSPA